MLARSLVVLLLAALGVAGLRLVSAGLHHYADAWGPPVAIQNHSLSVLAGLRTEAVQARNRRLVYPYSVVPGGVRTADELHEAAAHDPTVATHYAGFDYKRAKVVKVAEPRLVYLSYRLGNRIYWTRKQASLHPGEPLLTDGKITARGRCGNQVSVLPQSNTSPAEPMIAELDQPDALASGGEFPPSSFHSSLLQPEPIIPVGPESPAGGAPAGGGGGPLGPGPPGVSMPFPVSPPIIGGGGCVPSKKNNYCKSAPPPPPVPEPGTVVLVFSGAALVLARYRRARA